MPSFEVKPADADIAQMTISWVPDSVVFITQIGMAGVKQTAMLGPEEARQTIAVLSAYVAKQNEHASDCALHNSPAEEIGPCDCGGMALKDT